MFNSKKKQEPEEVQLADRNKPLTLFDRNPAGEIIGMFSVPRDAVLHTNYNAVKNEMQMTLKAIRQTGETYVEPVQNVVGSFDSEGNLLSKKRMQSSTLRELYFSSGFNIAIKITDEAEMRKAWYWLDNGVEFDELIEVRNIMLENIKTAKEAAQKREEEAKKLAEEQGTADGVAGPALEQAEEQSKIITTEAEPNPEAKLVNIQDTL